MNAILMLFPLLALSDFRELLILFYTLDAPDLLPLVPDHSGHGYNASGTFLYPASDRDRTPHHSFEFRGGTTPGDVLLNETDFPFDARGPWTIMAWVYPTCLLQSGYSNEDDVQLFFGATIFASDAFILAIGRDKRLKVWIGDVSISSYALLSVEEWTHVGLTLDSSGVDMFVNGEFDSWHPIVGAHPRQPERGLLSLGAKSFFSGYFAGRMNDFSLHQRRLSAVEVFSAFEQRRSGFSRPPPPSRRETLSVCHESDVSGGDSVFAQWRGGEVQSMAIGGVLQVVSAAYGAEPAFSNCYETLSGDCNGHSYCEFVAGNGYCQDTFYYHVKTTYVRYWCMDSTRPDLVFAVSCAENSKCVLSCEGIPQPSSSSHVPKCNARVSVMPNWCAGNTYECQKGEKESQESGEDCLCYDKSLTSSQCKAMCPEPFVGEKCEEYQCYGKVSTDASVCSSAGKCILTCHQSSCNASCVCSREDLVDDCGRSSDCSGVPHNDPSVCSGHGRCFLAPFDPHHQEQDAFCVCDSSFGGKACEFSRLCFGLLPDSPLVCSRHGTCESSPMGNAFCKCDKGYEGPKCDLKTAILLGIGIGGAVGGVLMVVCLFFVLGSCLACLVVGWRIRRERKSGGNVFLSPVLLSIQGEPQIALGEEDVGEVDFDSVPLLKARLQELKDRNKELKRQMVVQ